MSLVSDHQRDDAGMLPGMDRRHRPADFFHERTNFNFIAKSRVFLIMFLIVVVGGPLLLILRPLSLGIDFNGGVSWQVDVAKGHAANVNDLRKIVDTTTLVDYKATISSSPQSGKKTIRVQAQVVNDPIEAIRSAIAKIVGKKTADVNENRTGTVQSFSVSKVVGVEKATIESKLKAIDLGGAKANVSVAKQQVTVTLSAPPKSVRERVSSVLAKYAGKTTNDVSISTVGPTWGGEVSKKAITALIVFFFVLAIYLSIRFEFKMAMAALVAVVHDIIFTVAVYAITQFTVSPATVTAFLTILGFSLYDTVVVFDKIKENQGPAITIGKATYGEMANRSLNEVLMRSLSTSFVALMPVLSLLVVGAGFFGATALEDFALALFAGLFVGTYSSIFVATPMLVWWKEREPQYRAIAERQLVRAQTAQRKAARSAALVGEVIPVDAVAQGADDWDSTGVAGPPAIMRTTGNAPRPRQQRGRKRT